MPLDPKSLPEITTLAEKIGTFIEYWGFKKIHGQIWLHAYLCEKPIDATTLSKRINVSKALVSLAVKDLLEYKVLEVVGQGNRGKILLKSNPNLNEVIVNVLRLRERQLLSQIMFSFHNVKKICVTEKNKMSLCSQKLEELGDMIESAEATLDAVIGNNLDLSLNDR